MRTLRLLVACSIVLWGLDAFAQTPSPTAPPAANTDLSGLWEAKRSFGSLAQVRLIVSRSHDAYHADMLGWNLPMQSQKGILSFSLPNGEGMFRGRLQKDGSLAGHWFGPRRSGSSWGNASPVTLKPDRPAQWVGTVTAAQDELTFFMLLRADSADSWSAVLRNPERDFGSLWRVSKLVRQGRTLKLMGQIGGKETVVGEGSYDPEREQMTLVFNRGSFDFSRAGDDSEFYPRGKKPARYVYRPPLALEDGWPTDTLAAADIDQPAIEKLIQQLVEMPMDSNDAPQYDALLIARHGKLVLEEYFHGEHRDKLHNIRSAGKSITSILIGAVMQNGAPLQLSSPVYQVMNGGLFPAGLDPQKRTMSLENLVTMSSGYFCDDTNEQAPGNEDRVWDEQDQHPDFYKFALQLPMATPPGEKSVYCSIQPTLALGMVARATREFPLDSFDRLISRPLHLDRYAWPLDGAGNPYGGGGVALLPRDFLKFGQVMLNEGAWGGRQIISRDFARASISPQYHLRRISYGYLWWIEDLPYKNRKVRAFMALGNGGNNIVGVPELDLVVALYASNYGSRTTGKIREVVPKLLLPAVRERGDDKNAPVAEHEYTNPYGRSDDGSRITPKRIESKRNEMNQKGRSK